MVREAITTARAAGATGRILVRGDAAYGSAAVVAACVQARVQFSIVLTKNAAVNRAIAGRSPPTRGPRCATRGRWPTGTPVS